MQEIKTKSEITIIHSPTKEEPFIVIHKPAGLPSAPLSIDDKNNAFCKAAELFPSIIEVSGKKEIEHGLIHRLDTATSGLVLIATTQDFYDYIIEQQAAGKVIKTYIAKCDYITENAEKLGGYPSTKIDFESNKTIVESYFRPYGPGRKEVRPVDESCGKAALEKIGKLVKYTTEITIQSKTEHAVEVICKINNGYRHQVRSHLSWCGLPVKGDMLYNSSCKGDEKAELQFFAVGIEFILQSGKKVFIEKDM